MASAAAQLSPTLLVKRDAQGTQGTSPWTQRRVRDSDAGHIPWFLPRWGQMDGWTGGWLDRWIDGLLPSQSRQAEEDRQTDRQMHLVSQQGGLR